MTYANHLSDEVREKILHWLSPIELSRCHDVAREKHERRTGNWFISSSEFTDWKREAGQFLWLYGIREFVV